MIGFDISMVNIDMVQKPISSIASIYLYIPGTL